jgi:hypothetical protein
VQRAYYRLVQTSPPTVDDFRSHAALGKALLTTDLARRRMVEGVSVYATLAQARRNARAFPGHGSYIAELAIYDDTPAIVERTGRQPGDHTIWADPAELLRCVTSVILI